MNLKLLYILNFAILLAFSCDESNSTHSNNPPKLIPALPGNLEANRLISSLEAFDEPILSKADYDQLTREKSQLIQKINTNPNLEGLDITMDEFNKKVKTAKTKKENENKKLEAIKTKLITFILDQIGLTSFPYFQSLIDAYNLIKEKIQNITTQESLREQIEFVLSLKDTPLDSIEEKLKPLKQEIIKSPEKFDFLKLKYNETYPEDLIN